MAATETLLADIIAAPDDDAPRRRFAQHLRGLGVERATRRAGFIDAQLDRAAALEAGDRDAAIARIRTTTDLAHATWLRAVDRSRAWAVD